MSRIIPKPKVKPKKGRFPQSEVGPWRATEEHITSLGPERTPPPPLTPKQQLLLVGLTMSALIGLVAEYPRRHTIDFEAIVRARFMDGVREMQHKEREAGLKGGLAELAEADCRMTLEVGI